MSLKRPRIVESEDGAQREINKRLARKPRLLDLAAQMRARWQDEFARVGSLTLMPPPKGNDACWKLEDGVIKCFMSCVVCGLEKERTTEFFHANGVNLNTQHTGQEWLHNSHSASCVECYARIRHQERTTNDYKRALMNHYQHLHEKATKEVRENVLERTGDALPARSKTDGGLLVLQDLLEARTHCRITGIPFMELVFEPNHPYGPSINEIVPSTPEMKKARLDHARDNIELVFGIANVPEQGRPLGWRPFIEGTINPTSREVYTREDWERDLRVKPKDIGIRGYNTSKEDRMRYQDERRAKLLRYRLQCRLSNHIRYDKKKMGVQTPQLTVNAFMDLYFAQGGRCAISGVPTHPDDMSLDRIDNSKLHVDGNIRLVNYHFQCGQGHIWTRKRWLHIVLNMQQMVPVTPEARERLQTEMDSL